MGRHVRFTALLIDRVRALPLCTVLDKLQEDGLVFWRRDLEFEPVKSGATMRLYVSSPRGAAWELVVTGSKFFDTRMQTGGGGAIDLVRHLLGTDFRAAVGIRLC